MNANKARNIAKNTELNKILIEIKREALKGNYKIEFDHYIPNYVSLMLIDRGFTVSMYETPDKKVWKKKTYITWA